MVDRIAVGPLVVNSVDTGASWLRRAFEARWLRWLGCCSFSIYLWQQPAHYLIQHEHLALNPVVGGLLSVAIGMFCFGVIERPARRWINAVGAEAPTP